MLYFDGMGYYLSPPPHPDPPPAKKPEPSTPKSNERPPGSGNYDEVKLPTRRPIPIEKMLSELKTHHKTTHVFKIDNFSLLTEYKIEKVSSSVFDLGGHKWKLCVYPNGRGNAKNHVSVYLENQAKIDAKLKYELFVICQLEKKWHKSGKMEFEASSPKTEKGVPNFISLSDLKSKGYLFEDCCMFGATLHGYDQPAKVECFSLIKNPLNHKVTWNVTKFSSFDPDKASHSDEFVVGNRKWMIKIYTRGFGTEKGKSFSVYLLGHEFIKNAPNTETFAKFKLRVLDRVNWKDHVEKTCSGWVNTSLGFANFMPLEKLVEPYLVKDELYVGVDFEVISMTNYC